jgi:hypothetical protein
MEWWKVDGIVVGGMMARRERKDGRQAVAEGWLIYVPYKIAEQS